MKIPYRQKLTLLLSLSALYITGLLTWVLSHWFFERTNFGEEPSALRAFWLQMHGLAGLWFLVLFGFIFHSHLMPAWRRGRKRLTGSLLTAVLAFLSLTVPVLYYIANESIKNSTAIVHTYVGLAAVLVFLLHYFSKQA